MSKIGSKVLELQEQEEIENQLEDKNYEHIDSSIGRIRIGQNCQPTQHGTIKHAAYSSGEKAPPF